MFAEELMDAYPDARVILNQRPIDAWYESIVNSVQRIQESWVMWFLMNLDHQTRYARQAVHSGFFQTGELIYVSQDHTSLLDQDQRPCLSVGHTHQCKAYLHGTRSEGPRPRTYREVPRV